MRRVEWSNAFKADYQREKNGLHKETLGAKLGAVGTLLQNHEPLPAANCDHPLAGQWKGRRDCHVCPDLVLIYSKPKDAKGNDLGVVRFERLGSHSELGL
jgi:mRNA interferase YafQ